MRKRISKILKTPEVLRTDRQKEILAKAKELGKA